MHNHIYELPMTLNYVRHWGVKEAVRELIQNALDSESPFEYELGQGRLRLISRNSRLDPKTLLLGATTKANDQDTIGSFGEGYKLALLVLLREGKTVVVRNNEFIWRPEFRRSWAFREEVLAIVEQRATTIEEGVHFIIRDLTPEQCDEIRASCLQMQDSVGEVIQVPQGRILLERPAKLYVGGLYVCETSCQYGYDVEPRHLKLERDRQTVSNWDLKCLTKQMWFSADRPGEVAKMMEADCPDLEYAHFGMPELVKEACYNLFREKNPGAVVAKDNDELQDLVARGLKVVVVSSNFYSAVTESRGYRSEVGRQPQPLTPTEVLEGWLEENGRKMTTTARGSFQKIIEQSSTWRR